MELYPAALLDQCPDDADAAVPFFKNAGLSKVESMGAICRKFGLSLRNAKLLVHFHAAWAAQREADEALHDVLFEASENQG